jgi:alkanesulfonate monooxygenase SsuD/methylene tetrahydromethanopterin reductase-like flavin-dependent oxidoreductase (luciferase family)
VDVAINNNAELARKAVAPVILSNFRSSYPALTYLEDLPEFELSSTFLDALGRKDYQTRTYFRNPENTAELIPDTLLDHMSIAGTPDQVRNRIEDICEMKVFDEITIHPVPCEDQTLLDCLSLIAKMVFPNNQVNHAKQ